MIIKEEYWKRRTDTGSHKTVLLAIVIVIEEDDDGDGSGSRNSDDEEEEGEDAEDEEDDGDDGNKGGEEYQGRRCNDDVVTSSTNFQSVVFTGRSIPSKTRRCILMLPCALGLEKNKNKWINRGEGDRATEILSTIVTHRHIGRRAHAVSLFAWKTNSQSNSPATFFLQYFLWSSQHPYCFFSHLQTSTSTKEKSPKNNTEWILYIHPQSNQEKHPSKKKSRRQSMNVRDLPIIHIITS